MGFSERLLGGAVGALDRKLGRAISRALESGDFRGRSGESLPLYPAVGGKLQRVLLVGLGSADSVDAAALRSAAVFSGHAGGAAP